MSENCEQCGNPIELMCRKNTGFCSERCAEDWHLDHIWQDAGE